MKKLRELLEKATITGGESGKDKYYLECLFHKYPSEYCRTLSNEIIIVSANCAPELLDVVGAAGKARAKLIGLCQCDGRGCGICVADDLLYTTLAALKEAVEKEGI